MTEEKLREKLREIIAEEYIDVWLNAPNKQFFNLKPIEVLKSGDNHTINEMIYFLRSGSPI